MQTHSWTDRHTQGQADTQVHVVKAVGSTPNGRASHNMYVISGPIYLCEVFYNKCNLLISDGVPIERASDTG